MKVNSASAFSLLLALAQSAAIERRQQGDGPGGSADATQGDLGERPPPRFPFPVTKFPVPNETVVLKEAMYILPGQVFDGGMKRYERVEGSCNEQAGMFDPGVISAMIQKPILTLSIIAEGTDADAVFNLLPGSTIRNVIIGKHQAEGIHALGDAWVENVWWEDVCEDALTSKGLNTQLRVIGGGARNATDKVGLSLCAMASKKIADLSGRSSKTTRLAGSTTSLASMLMDSEFVKSLSMLTMIRNPTNVISQTFYQSCGNCLNQSKRNATIQNVIAVNGNRMGIINPNYGDEIRIKNTQLKDLKVMVDKEIANNMQTVPITVGTGPDQKYALYNETRDAITEWEGIVENAYEPEEPYEWLEAYWPDGFN
ncbi:polysaccharide lyase family 3 [Colletotrichum melonis]|uniref:Pectate lyase n=1 Tax=Colletotrichum melonis TaxID=1209925 RepID=A0AAI9UUW8_9PEZI|nr:polysaccharide lyase family 3 [Colletotrichum melonis]